MLDNYVNIEFRIKYETKEGEEVYIFGDSDDFGQWKEKKFKLDWSNGHIWKKEHKFKVNKSNDNNLIYYKFAISRPNKDYDWEKGPNRILDLTNLYNFPKENNKYILNLKWEIFDITFKLHYNLDVSDSCICILGEGPFLGEWKQDKIEEFKMENMKKKENKFDLWQKNIEVSFDKLSINDKSVEMKFEYKYLIYDYKNKKIEYEFGKKNRYLKILFRNKDIDDELKFMSLTLPKEYKLLTNSVLEIDDSYFIKEGKK